MPNNQDSAKFLFQCPTTKETRCIPISPDQQYLRIDSNGLAEIVIESCPECRNQHVIATLGYKKYFDYLNMNIPVKKVETKEIIFGEHTQGPCLDCSPGCIACGGSPQEKGFRNNQQRIKDLIGI